MIPRIANKFQNCLIDLNTNEEFDFPFGVSLQRGVSVLTRETRRVDGSKKSQNLFRRLGVQAQRITVTYNLLRDEINVKTLPTLESLAGREVELYFNQYMYGEFCVVEVTLTPALDGVAGITNIGVSLSLTERHKVIQPPKIYVSTL